MRRICPRRVMQALPSMAIGMLIGLGIWMTVIALVFALVEIFA